MLKGVSNQKCRTADKSDIDVWANDIVSQIPILLNKIILNSKAECRENAAAALVETLRFLFLCSISSSSLTPSKHVDDVWHEFILFTRTYQHFCEAKFGNFVHHQPTNDQTNELKQYRTTLRLYQQYFGQPDTNYWPSPDNDVAHCGLCEN